MLGDEDERKEQKGKGVGEKNKIPPLEKRMGLVFFLPPVNLEDKRLLGVVSSCYCCRLVFSFLFSLLFTFYA